MKKSIQTNTYMIHAISLNSHKFFDKKITNILLLNLFIILPGFKGTLFSFFKNSERHLNENIGLFCNNGRIEYTYHF